MRFVARCSKQCAIQPATRLTANVGVNNGSSSTRGYVRYRDDELLF